MWVLVSGVERCVLVNGTPALRSMSLYRCCAKVEVAWRQFETEVVGTVEAMMIYAFCILIWLLILRFDKLVSAY